MTFSDAVFLGVLRVKAVLDINKRGIHSSAAVTREVCFMKKTMQDSIQKKSSVFSEVNCYGC